MGFGDKNTRPQYKGEVENGKPNRLGVLIYPYNGKIIVGEWKNGKEWKTKHRTKYGRLILKFEMGKNGQGTRTYPNGEKYVGEYKDGLENGQGTTTYPDGSKYVGEFKDGEYDGQGKYTWSDGDKEVGEWKKNELWNGTQYDKDGNIYGKYVNGEWIKQYPPLILHSQRHSKYPPLNSSQVRHTLHVKSSNIDTPGKF